MVGRKITVLMFGLLLGISACDIAPNPEQTPTPQPSPTLDETAIAMLFTDTPSPTASITSTSSATVTPSSTPTDEPTNTPSITPSPTITPSITATPSNTSTDTLSPTPTPTSSATNTPTATSTATQTPTNTATNTPRPTSTHTETQTPTPTDTFTASPTNTPTATDTPSSTPSATNTMAPSNTPTSTASPTATATLTPSNTPTATNTLPPSPTATLTASSTNTPPPTPTLLPTRGPSNTPTETRTPSPTLSPTVTLTPTRTSTATSTVTLTPSPTNTREPSVTPFSTSTRANFPTAEPIQPDVIVQATEASASPVTPQQIDRNATEEGPDTVATNPSSIGSTDPTPGGNVGGFSTPTPTIIILPTADSGPVVQPTNTPFAFTEGGAPASNNSGVIFNNGSQFVNSGGAAVVEGALAFDFGPQSGQVAGYYPDGYLYVNGTQVNAPPFDFGIGNKTITRVQWSPSGGQVAFIVDGNDPGNAFSDGVWIYDVGSGSVRQIFRNTIGYQRALDVQWSPNSGAMIVTLRSESPPGIVQVILASNHDANNTNYPVHTYSQATWAADTGSVIVSGRNTDGSIVLGRISLPNQNYTPISAVAPDVVFTYAALEPSPGRIYFLGGPSERGPFALYSVDSGGGTATPISSNSILGALYSSEWNAGRNTLLAVFDTDTGRRAYTFSTAGAVFDVTPPGGVVGEVRWP